ncbi:MAG: radical SAM protein [Desulfuromonadaceae bacterium]
MKILLVLHNYNVPISDPCCYPLGYMTISAVLKRAGHDVTINNQNLYHALPLEGYDAVLFTGFEHFLEDIKRDAAICKGLGIHTVLGGALATFKPEEMLQHVDTVVVGEGENVVEQALTTSGIIYGTKPDLNTIPLPDYEGFGVAEYHKRNGFKHIGVLTQRGCPNRCRFCAQTCKTQARDIDQVMAEIDSYGDVDTVIINDNTLNTSKSRFMEICGRMTKPWTAAIRVDRFDEEMAIAAKKSRCRYFVVGIESFRQDKLDAMRKGIKVEQIYSCLDLLHKYDIGYHGCILTGLPGETTEDIIEELKELPAGYNFFPVLVQPFVGTEYQTRSISDEDAANFTALFTEIATSRNMTVFPTL